AEAGPLSCTASWYVSVSPTIAGSGETRPLSTRSARGALTVLVKPRVLLAGSGSASGALAVAVACSVPAPLAVALTRSVAPLPARWGAPARLEQEHVLAVHRSAPGLFEDPAVLRSGARPDPGLHTHRAAQVKTRGSGHDHRRAAGEGRRAVTAHRAGLTEAHPRLVAGGDAVAAGIKRAGRSGGFTQPPVPRRLIGEQTQRHTRVARPTRAAPLRAGEGAAALARGRAGRADLGRQLPGEAHRAR